jgi:hypothetical protein
LFVGSSIDIGIDIDIIIIVRPCTRNYNNKRYIKECLIIGILVEELDSVSGILFVLLGGSLLHVLFLHFFVLIFQILHQVLLILYC